MEQFKDTEEQRTVYHRSSYELESAKDIQKRVNKYCMEVEGLTGAAAGATSATKIASENTKEWSDRV